MSQGIVATQESRPKPIGRPSPYKPEYCQLVEDHLGRGGSMESAGGIFGVAKRTVYYWAERHEDFLHAVERGEARRAIFVEDMLKRLALTGGGNAAAAIFLATNWTNMKNAYRQETTGADGKDLTFDVRLSLNAGHTHAMAESSGREQGEVQDFEVRTASGQDLSLDRGADPVSPDQAGGLLADRPVLPASQTDRVAGAEQVRPDGDVVESE